MMNLPSVMETREHKGDFKESRERAKQKAATR